MAEPTVREILEEQLGVEQPQEEIIVAEPEAVESAEQKAERARDEAGRFKAADKTEKVEKVEKAASPNKEAPLENQAATITEPQELPPIQRPSSWKKELWPIWDKMAAGQPLTAQESRQVAEYNHFREQQFAGGVSTYKQEAERVRPLVEAVAPYQAEMAQYGIEPSVIVSNLLAAQRTLSFGSPHQKLNMLAQIAKNHGIPLDAFTNQDVQNQYLATPHQAPPTPQPDINKVVQAVLEQREITQTVQQMERNTEKYPFFPYVRNSMAQLLEAREATDLDEAYQRALELPEHSLLSTVMQQQQSAADEQRKLEVAKKTAQVARANTLSTKSATPAIVNVNGKTSVREALVEAMSAHSAAGRV